MKAIGPESWKRLRQLLDRALEVDGDARRAFVDSLDGEDAALRDDLVRVLAQHETLGQQSMANAMDLAVPAVADSIKDDAVLDQTRVGQTVGPYRLVRLLGAGGMGAVYLAERTSQDFAQQVALKLVRNAFATATTEERFERERRILAALKHPGIALLFDGGRTQEGQAFYTMEYVDGEAVSDFCRHLAITARVRLLLQVASALAYAHQNLVVHRDIKPSNVLVTADCQAKLVDFGLAKLLDNRTDSTTTQANAGPMTPAYAAPEQFHNGAVTVATDVYQFGVLCFVVLTGRLPYRADPDDSLEWARAVTEQEPMTLAQALEMGEGAADKETSKRLRRQLTADLDAIARTALAKAPEDRYRSMDAMIADLDAYLDGRPVNARRAGPLYFTWRFVQRWRYTVAATVMAFMALAATTLVAVRQSHLATAEADRANTVANFLISLFKVSDPGINRGEKLTANQILDRGAEQLDHEMASLPEQRGQLLGVIGRVYSMLGDYRRARPLLEKAVATLRTTPHPNPTDVGHYLTNLAWVVYQQGDLKAAIRLLDDAISTLGHSTQDSVWRAGALNYRALAFKSLGDYRAARDDFASSIRLEKEIDSAGDTADSYKTADTASAHNNYGTLLLVLDDIPSAQAEFDQALALYQKYYGEHSDTQVYVSGTKMNLALVLVELGELSKAERAMDAVSANFLKTLGPAHPGYAAAQDLLGEIARQEQQFDKALEYYAVAERAYRQALGDNHPSVSNPIHDRALVNLDRGNFAAALDGFEQALDLRRKSLDSESVEVAETLDGRCQAFLALGRYDEAKQDCDQSARILSAKFPAEHRLMIYSLLHVGLSRYALGDRDGAQAALREVAVRAQSTFANRPVQLTRIRSAIEDPQRALTHPVTARRYR